MRPLVLLPAYPLLAGGRVDGWRDPGVAVPATYVEAVRRAGGVEAIVLPTPLADAEAAALLDRVDGLLLLGGSDLAPAAYGHEAVAEVYGVSPERDACELTLTRLAVGRGLPVLAICRGHQVLNVALGGTLDQHITGRPGLLAHGVPAVEGGGTFHDVEVAGGTRLADALGETVATACSSHHHQAVELLAEGLRVSARAPDGVIEGIELDDPDGPWVVGVQWHPEDTAGTDPVQQRLFDAFVRRASGA